MVNLWVCANTDGLIVQIPDTDEAFAKLDEVCYRWEQTCSTDKCGIVLAFDQVDWIWQKDVNNYLFKFTGQEKYAEVYHTRMALKAAGKKKEQAPYKKLLNSLSGAMKDPMNPAYDPCMNNTMVVNCQLMLIMLLEWLEAEVDGFELIQLVAWLN